MFLIAFLVGFFIGSLFINLFSTTYDTIMVCYLIERNIEENYSTKQRKYPPELESVMQQIQIENDRRYKRMPA